MHLVLFLALIAQCLGDVHVSIDRIKGEYNVSVNSQVWLRSAGTSLYVRDRWYSSSDNSLPLIDSKIVQGEDPLLGAWNETVLIYNLTIDQTSVNVTGQIRQWDEIPALTFHLNTGTTMLTNKIVLNISEVRTVFPSFKIEQNDENDRRGYFTFEGKRSCIVV